MKWIAATVLLAPLNLHGAVTDDLTHIEPYTTNEVIVLRDSRLKISRGLIFTNVWSDTGQPLFYGASITSLTLQARFIADADWDAKRPGILSLPFSHGLYHGEYRAVLCSNWLQITVSNFESSVIGQGDGEIQIKGIDARGPIPFAPLYHKITNAVPSPFAGRWKLRLRRFDDRRVSARAIGNILDRIECINCIDTDEEYLAPMGVGIFSNVSLILSITSVMGAPDLETGTVSLFRHHGVLRFKTSSSKGILVRRKDD